MIGMLLILLVVPFAFLLLAATAEAAAKAIIVLAGMAGLAGIVWMLHNAITMNAAVGFGLIAFGLLAAAKKLGWK